MDTFNSSLIIMEERKKKKKSVCVCSIIVRLVTVYELLLLLLLLQSVILELSSQAALQIRRRRQHHMRSGASITSRRSDRNSDKCRGLDSVVARISPTRKQLITMCGKKYPRKFFAISLQSIGILERNFTCLLPIRISRICASGRAFHYL